MNPKSLTPKDLKALLISGSYQVIQSREKINEINVFPVPDGDTGTNLALTCQSLLSHILSIRDDSQFKELAAAISSGVLLGAHGNSGAIFAQFWSTLAKEWELIQELSLEIFTKSIALAFEATFNSIHAPAEGTILTAMREWSSTLIQLQTEATGFSDLLQKSQGALLRAVSQTMEQNPILKKNQVVDAGAQGFSLFWQGALDTLLSGKINSEIHDELTQIPLGHSEADFQNEEILYRYCTECLIKGDDLDSAAIKSLLETKDLDCLIVVGGNHLVKAHFHTNTPEEIFQELQEFGTLLNQKADDMIEQNLTMTSTKRKTRVAIVTDSSCNLPSQFVIKNSIHVVPLNLSFENRTYIDGFDLNTKSFYEKLEKDPTLSVSTSQPSPGQFQKGFKAALTGSGEALSILVGSAMSGTFRSAGIAKSTLPSEDATRITLYDSQNVSGGLGLIVQKALSLTKKNQSIAEITQELDAYKQSIRSFVSIRSLDRAAAGGRVPKKLATLARRLNLYPLLTLNSEGNVKIKSLSLGFSNNCKKALSLSLHWAKSLKNPQFMLCHAEALSLAEDFRTKIQAEFPKSEILISPVTPTLGAHTGSGSIAIFIGEGDVLK